MPLALIRYAQIDSQMTTLTRINNIHINAFRAVRGGYREAYTLN